MTRMTMGWGLAAGAMMLALSNPAAAQWSGGTDSTGGRDRTGGSGVGYGDAVGAAILSDVSRDRQAEKDARRAPYATPGYGRISNETQARKACVGRALGQVGRGSKLIGTPYSNTMSTGWEVEGRIDAGQGKTAEFVCSVRNGSVSGVLIR